MLISLDTVLLIGGEGLLGAALNEDLSSRGIRVHSASRNSSDVKLDIRDDFELECVIKELRPSIVINCAAIVSLLDCEKNPCNAWLTNARPSAILSNLSHQYDFKYVYISTDHFFDGRGNYQHDESHPVKLLNEYARTKYVGEMLAISNIRSLAVRTNIVGLRRYGPPTFADWCLRVINDDQSVKLYVDHFVSSIDIWNFSKVLVDVIQQDLRGLINIASSESFSKADFILELAEIKGKCLSNGELTQSNFSDVNRPNSLGLSTKRVEKILGLKMPTLKQVCQNIVGKEIEWRD